MKLTSIVAIYTLFWALSFFLVLPFRLRRPDATEVSVTGEMRGSQGGFSFGRTSIWTTVVSVVLFGLYYANYVEHWVSVESFDLVPAWVLERH